ncbi:cupredoxin domain-containing protein [Herbaspirillum rhizosphaerae]|uniref:cupredoxin domain-containing protein n=1 Tax=Herbaspirillum rhizosphaerae TaxID=346179 RepID=UPI00067B37A9|nr:cupredoxin family protein [Herbaspirillum rhizosphaerae]
MKPVQTKNLFIAAVLAAAAFHAAAQNMASMPPHHAEHAGHAEHADDVFGQPGAAGKVTRTIKVDMRDNMRFTPETLKVKAGDTIRFVVSNSGKFRHELVFGTETQLKAHYAAMLKNPEMEHADDNQISLAPGKSGELIWQFTQAGTVNFACLQPGHYDAGMKGSVTVVAAEGLHKH